MILYSEPLLVILYCVTCRLSKFIYKMRRYIENCYTLLLTYKNFKNNDFELVYLKGDNFFNYFVMDLV